MRWIVIAAAACGGKAGGLCASDEECADGYGCRPEAPGANAAGCVERCEEDLECAAAHYCDGGGRCVESETGPGTTDASADGTTDGGT